MKKYIALLLTFLVLVTGCSNSSSTSSKTTESSGKTDGEKAAPSFVFVVTSQLGDKSFNDSAAAGMEKITKDLGYVTKTIEIGSDQTKWEPTILDLSDSGEYTAIFLNGSGTKEIVEGLAEDYPDQKYVLFDTSIEEGSAENIYAINYKQNEGSYLGGVVAGLVTSSDMEYANPEHKIGFIGGDENPIISDFLVGYIEGAKSVVEDVEVYVSYVGSWTDTAKGKELAISQYNAGCDIIFPAAMTAGMGAIEAAAEMNKYIIGVDSDQAALFADTDEKMANVILTSVVKEVGASLFRYAEMEGKGEVTYGTTEVLGIKEGASDIVYNTFYEKNVPEDIRKKVDEAREKVLAGDITISTALGVDPAEVDAIIESVKPK